MTQKDIFCENYKQWKKEGKIIFENEHAYSILNVTPAVPYHSLIVPKKHVVDLEDLNPDELKGFVI